MPDTAFVTDASFTQSARLRRSEAGLAYDNVPVAWRIEGPVDVPALRCSLASLVERHEILRTTLRVVDGRVAQVIAPRADVPLEVTDLRHEPASARGATLAKLAAADASEPFDLTKLPLFRVRLVALGPTQHVLLLTATHAVWDGGSIEPFIRELSTLYQAHTGEGGAALADLPVQFADFVAWERTRLTPAAEQYWRSRPDDFWPIVNLERRSTVTSGPAALVTSVFPVASRSVVARLQALAKEKATTLRVVTLAASSAVLSLLSRRTELTFAAIEGNRTRPELESLIGCLAGYIFVTTETCAEVSFERIIGQTTGDVVDAYSRSAPLEVIVPPRLIDDLALDRHACVFDVIFNFVFGFSTATAQMGPDTHVRPIDPPRLPALPVDAYWHRAPLTFMFSLTASGTLLAEIVHATDVFDRAEVHRVAATLATVLRHAAVRPQAPTPARLVAEPSRPGGPWETRSPAAPIDALRTFRPVLDEVSVGGPSRAPYGARPR
jgi:hypothetical protein